ncbi:hypothetical protein AGABI2DRAFT_122518 [Agaricus bisporus var. bisporus H97]|uniref:hypothetical protein n=1 Tax=Agaricus bisporus var. bisporus (strain H97 / ATCC MYA-4626 / FGSC 10389) TaxID=936046 RepID=UPI00029F5A4C|nr:hypothetical protein AGABI2DRAFT_122518 [Agaricus bisporus var. bisporus H97]EKV42952.1 hypothetical protein AGABI2DRAFT_122518 [Agaricus bisporus var. bisporus H97]
MYEEWFQKFPERVALFGEDVNPDSLNESKREELAEAVFVRKEQLNRFIRWHSDYDNEERSPATKNRSIGDLLKKREPKHRKKRIIDVYSSLYYKTKIGPEVDRLMEKVTETGRQYSSIHMAAVQRLKREFWNKETAEVRHQVKEHRVALAMAAEDEEDKETEDEGEDKDLKSKLAEMKLRGKEIRELVGILDMVAKELNARTGFIMTFLIGGLEINCALKYSGLHFGKTTEGKYNFKESMIDFEERIMRPWCGFLERIFSKAKQQDQAELYKKVFGIKGSAEQPGSGPMDTDAWSLQKDNIDDNDEQTKDEDNNEREDDEEKEEDDSHPNKEGSPTPNSPPNKEGGPMVPSPVATEASASPAATILAFSSHASDVMSLTSPSSPIAPSLFEDLSTSACDVNVLPTPTGSLTPPQLHLDNYDTQTYMNTPMTLGPLSQELNWALHDAQSQMNSSASAHHAGLLQQNYMPNGGMEFSNNPSTFFDWLGDGSWLAATSPGGNGSMSSVSAGISSSPVPMHSSSGTKTPTTPAEENSPLPIDLTFKENSVSNIPPAPAPPQSPSRPPTTAADNAPPPLDPPSMLTATISTMADASMDTNLKRGRKSKKGRIAPTQPTVPLQDLNSHLGRSTRERKRRDHPDATFQQQQEAREHEQKRRRVDANKTKGRKKNGRK